MKLLPTDFIFRTMPLARRSPRSRWLAAVLPLALAVPAPIVAADVPTVLSTLRVSGSAQETATGPVAGYVAQRSATATKTDTLLADTPQSITVVTADQVRDQGALTVQDALRYVAGVRGEPYGLDSRGDWSMIRGSEPVLFVDGMQQTFGYYASSRPDPFVLERIEVLKGPASVLYGQGTVGGLINLVSKRPRDERAGELQLQYGTFSRKQAAADVTGPLDAEGRWRYRVVAVKRDSDTQVDDVPDDRALLMPSLTWRPSDRAEWTLIASYQKDETGSSTQFFPHAGTVLPAPNGLPDIPIDRFMSERGFDRYDTEQHSLTSLFSYALSDTWTLRQNLRYAESEVDYRTLYPAFPPVLQDNGDIDRVYWVAKPDLDYVTVDNQLQAEFGHERLHQVVLIGADYQHAVTNRTWAYGAGGTLNVYHPVYGDFTPPGAGDFLDDPENTVEQLGFYAQDQLTFNQRWIAVLGLRSDRAKNRIDGGDTQIDDAVTGRIAFMYKAANGLSPYISYTESFQPVIGLDIHGNPFDPLEGEQYEIGVKYQPEGGESSVSAAVYTLREKNCKVPDPVIPMNEVQTGEAKAKGFELEALLQVTENWQLIGNYTYTDTEVTEADARLPSVPEHMASVWSQYHFAIAGVPGFRAGVGVRYVGDSWDGADNVTTPSYTLYDAMFGYDAGAWSAAINANNLEDETYYTTCLARGDCFIGTRRNVVGTVSYRY